jgi:hypothetical protein
MQDATTTRIPDVTLKAFGHGRELRFASLGVPAVLIFVARETSEAAGPVTRGIREKYPQASDVLVCNIADVRGIPRLLRKVVEQIMKSSYKDAVERLEPGRAPEDYVLIVPDFDDALIGPLGVEDVKEKAAVAVISADGAVVAKSQGDDLAGDALAALSTIIPS